MEPGFYYTPLEVWSGADAPLPGVKDLLKKLKPHQTLLLLSDGSLTLDLELLFGSRVEVEVKGKGTKRLSKDQALYLEEDVGTEAMEREVWLTVNKKRLVYAHSIIPYSCIEGGLLEDLEKRSDEPLGRVLTSKKIFFLKGKLELSTVKCESAAADLGIDAGSPFITRRYILYNGEPGQFVIKAAIMEIFSPEIISAEGY